MAAVTKHYDPRNVYESPEDESDKSVIWTTPSIEMALDAMKKGQRLRRSPFFEGDPRKRRGGIVFQLSDWELDEITKCAADIRYFIKHYVKVKRPDGIIGLINLRSYQQQQVDDLLENMRVIFGWSRQSGKTVGTAIYILWKMMFFVDKSAALLANKAGTAAEVLDKIKSIYINLPFFLQAGVVGWNGGSVSFDNDCRIFTGPATLDALNGKTCNILYIDEFAFLGKGANKYEFQKEFLANANPIVSAQEDGQIIISSTPNGKDLFYEIFNKAIKKQNSYKASKVIWWQIPGKTAQWAKNEIADIGADKFKIQYELSFDASQDSLLGMRTLKHIEKHSLAYAADGMELLSRYEQFLYFHPDVDLSNKHRQAFLLSCDLAEGLQQDYSVCQILRLQWNKDKQAFRYEQIGVWRSNEVALEEFAKVVAELFNNLNPNYSKLLVEQNTYGDLFFKCLALNEVHDVDLEAICRFKRSADSDAMIKGLRTNSKIKQLAVKAFQTLMVNGQLELTEKHTVEEVVHFKKNVKGGYEAELGHDDCVTPLINACYFITMAEVEFQNWTEDYRELIGLADAEVGIKMQKKKNKNEDDEDDDIDVSKLSPEVRALLHSV